MILRVEEVDKMAKKKVEKTIIEVGEDNRGSIESQSPRIHESREDLSKNPQLSRTYQRPDPLKVEGLKDDLSPFWEKDSKDTINIRESLGFRIARKTDFKDQTNFKKKYGDVVLMVAPKDMVEESKSQRLALRQSIENSRGSQRTEPERLKGYVSGHSFE